MTNTKSLNLLETPFKLGSTRAIKKKVSNNHLDEIATGQILSHLIKRHKFGLVTAWAVLVTISYVFPPVWDILGSMVH